MINRLHRVAWLCFLVTAFLFLSGCTAYQNYEVPFAPEDVKSITVSDQWAYKVIEDTDGIHKLISLFNKIEIVSDYDPEREPVPMANYACSFLVQLNDGTQLEYGTAELSFARSVFTDETGAKYKVRNFLPAKIWNQLDYEALPINLRNQ